jgi:hypothetical protein
MLTAAAPRPLAVAVLGGLMVAIELPAGLKRVMSISKLLRCFCTLTVDTQSDTTCQGSTQQHEQQPEIKVMSKQQLVKVAKKV